MDRFLLMTKSPREHEWMVVVPLDAAAIGRKMGLVEMADRYALQNLRGLRVKE